MEYSEDEEARVLAMGGGTRGAAMVLCHPMFLEMEPRLWPGVARVRGGQKWPPESVCSSIALQMSVAK